MTVACGKIVSSKEGLDRLSDNQLSQRVNERLQRKSHNRELLTQPVANSRPSNTSMRELLEIEVDFGEC